MINKLRQKFIIVSTAIITLVVSTVFIIVNLLNYYNIYYKGSESIDKLKGNTLLMENIVRGEKTSLEIINDTRGVIIATIDSDNKVSKIYSKNLQIDSHTQEELVVAALKNTENDYKAFVENFEYEYANYQGKNVLFLVDVDRELSVFNLFLFNSLVVVSIIVLIVSVLLVLMSNKVIAPVAENIKKQKQFITYASHELKTPLAIISSNADLLGIENGKSKWLRNIQKQIERLSELITSLIEFSRAEEKETIEKKKFSLTQLVEERVEDFEELAYFNSKGILANIEKDIYYNGEYESIFQVVDILLDNAIKYSDEESDIQVSLFTVKNVPYLKIINRSEHVKAGNLDIFFDRFYRDEHTRENNQGYGLGLALAKLQLDRHDAKVRAYAEKDGEFTIEINFKS